MNGNPSTSERSHPCGTINTGLVGETVRLAGWAARIRDLGGVTFVDLRPPSWRTSSNSRA